MEKKDYIKRIAIVGPESTGKSTLCEYLAREFNTNWVPEFAREFLSGKSNQYSEQDVLFIAKEQLLLEDKMAETANDVLFCDTNLLVIKIWEQVVFGKVDQWVINEMQNRKYTLHLLCNVDHPWVEDPLREHPNKRAEIFEMYKNDLLQSKTNFIEVQGVDEQRLSFAKKQVKDFLLNNQ